MEPAKSFKDLIVWQKAHQHVLGVSAITARFPKNELFGLTHQMRRAAGSVAANIVDGFKQSSAAEKLRFLTISESSLEECRYDLLLASGLTYGTDPSLGTLQEEVGKLIAGYGAGIRRRVSR